MTRQIAKGVFLLAVMFGFLAFSEGQRPQKAKSEKKIQLFEPKKLGEVSLEEVLSVRRSVRQFSDRTLNPEQIGQLAWAGQGITNRSTGFRTAPSAGAIYPMTLYIATNEGLFAYDPAEHALKLTLGRDIRAKLAAEAFRQDAVAQGGCDIIIAGSVRKLAAKYGSKARRYILIEAGHIAQNILLQATAMGLGAVPIGAFDIKGVARTCRLDKELEPFYIICIGYPAVYGRSRPGEQKVLSYINEQSETKKAALIIASYNFRDEELFETKNILDSANVNTVVASTKTGTITGMLGGKAEAQLLLDQLNVDDYDAVVFIGGTGASEYFGNATALKIAHQAAAKKKVVAAICIAPAILANAGILQNVRATCFSSQKGRLIRAGANYTGAAVERDGLVITASGPTAAKLFGRVIVEALIEK